MKKPVRRKRVRRRNKWDDWEGRLAKGEQLFALLAESGYKLAIQSDSVNLLKSLPDESVDLLITDPAYESLEKWRKVGTTTRLKQSKGSSNKWFQTFPNAAYWPFFEQLYRVMKKGTFIFIFCDEETRDIITTGFSPQSPPASVDMWHHNQTGPRAPLLLAGFKYWKALVWDKVHKGMGYHFPAQHEFIIMAEKVVRKGKHRKLNTNKVGDVIAVPRLKGKHVYPTEKPYQLIRILVEEGSNPGDLVLDPFAGSGVVGTVCKDIDRKVLLGDVDIEEARKRMRR